MRLVLRETAGDDALTALKLSYDALDTGELQQARELAQSVLIAARASASLVLEARALACLAHCDRAAARLQRSSDTSRKAAQIFERIGDIEGEAAALTTLAHVSMLLGRNDDAVEAASMCVRLCDLQPTPQPAAVFAHNCLGIAYGWSSNFEAAEHALGRAIHTAEACRPAVSTYEPRINLAWVEAARLVDERYQTGTMASVEKFDRLVREFKTAEGQGDGVGITPALTPREGVVSIVLEGLAACWQAQAVAARGHADHAMRSLSGTPTWLDALVHWLTAELQWASRDWKRAEVSLDAMKEHAIAAEHEHLACLAHLMLVQVYELQDKHVDARHEHRLLRGRERRLNARSLASREAAVGWRLGVRQSERHLQEALIVSKKFEQLSLEDPLTGIANRRCFELRLAERLKSTARSGQPLTLAMIDVDRFKAVNDTYSHQVGDQVLKSIATLLTKTIRDGDMAARLAGDEFVVFFDNAELELAEEICDRIHKAVAAFNWEDIAAGLHPTISIGIDAAVDGDTVDTLLRRSDRSMYWTKPGWVPTNL